MSTIQTAPLDNNTQAHKHHPLWKRRLAHWARWVHVYLSMMSFAILFFFALTGITLNHQDRFTNEARSLQFRGTIDAGLLRPSANGEISKAQIVDSLRRTWHVKAALSDFRVEDDQVEVSFKGPGYESDAFIDRRTGNYELTENRMGFVAIINDLHKGRDTGSVWAFLIDVGAALMCLVSISGLVLIFFLQKRRMPGLMALAMGALLCLVVYRIWVP